MHNHIRAVVHWVKDNKRAVGQCIVPPPTPNSPAAKPAKAPMTKKGYKFHNRLTFKKMKELKALG